MKQQSGFTLVELAVVVLLIGMIAAMGITALSAQMASASISNTKKKQETIKDALIAYLGKYKRLPCPAVDASGGLDATVRLNAIPPNCKTNFGIVPYAELGLPRSAALDGWENFFTYAVSSKWTATLTTTAPINGGSTTNDATQAFNVGNSGTITVNSRFPASQEPPTKAADPTAATGAVVVLISHGKNGSGAYTNKGTQNAAPLGADESKNAPPQNTLPLTAAVTLPINGFFQRENTEIEDVTLNPYGLFDDGLQWFSANDLTTSLIKDGSLKSPEGQWAEQVANIKSAVIGYMFSPSNTSSCAPPSNVTPTFYFNGLLAANNISTSDPWGVALSYQRNICHLYSDGKTRQYVGAICDSSTVTSDTSGYAYTLAATGGPVTTPTINQLIGSYSNLLNNCP